MQGTATRDGLYSGTRVSPVPVNGRQTRHVRLAALPSAVPWARRIVLHMLRQWQLESMADAAALLVSELVTNAVEASAGGAGRDPGKLPMVGLGIRLTADSLVLEVADGNPLCPVRQELDIEGDHGRGLLLVDALADAWGHRAADGGKIVWCEMARASAPAGTSTAC
jgi:anti-sigma regulatory factor (Ser/Thr protein kinase)